jgi:hypothetical protein
MSDFKNTKSILAKLLAQEDLKVQHEKIPTAYFDVKNRVLGLPIWKDMSGELYDLLCGHEVGHALYTPPEGWHDEVTNGYKDVGPHFKGFLNVLEDARIEKKIKRRYPGIGPSFYKAYQGLWEQDFFEVKDKDLNELLFIDRVNILTKVGAYVTVNLEFTDQERIYIDRINNLETWAEVVELARELYSEAEDELKDKQQQIVQQLVGTGEFGEQLEDEDGYGAGTDPDGEYGQTQQSTAMSFEDLESENPESITDRAFRKREAELLDAESKPYAYYTMPKLDSRKFIFGYQQVMSEMNFSPKLENIRAQVMQAFNAKNLKVINYLVKEFELRRNAEQQARAKVSRSGELDVKKAHLYRISEDLFRKFTTVPNGKNHGLVMVFDMSSSMTPHMAGVIEQMLILVQFCRKVNISFDVYGFTNYNNRFEDPTAPNSVYARDFDKRTDAQLNHLVVRDPNFKLLHFFSDSMSAMQFKRQFSNLNLWAHSFGDRGNFDGHDIPMQLRLNSTPLHESIMVSGDVLRRFKDRTGADIVNMVYLTDGDSDSYVQSYQHYDHRDDEMFAIGLPKNTNITVTDEATGISIQTDQPYHRGQRLLLDLLRQTTGANVVNFHLANAVRREVDERIYDPRLEAPKPDLLESIMDDHRKNKVAVIENIGWSENYIIKASAMAIEDDVLDTTVTDKKSLTKAFMKMQQGKIMNRVLLNRFIRMVA